MRRKPVTLASGVSLLACMATVVLWICSYCGYSGLAILQDTPRGDWGWRNWFIYNGSAGTIFSCTDVTMNSVETFGAENGGMRWTCFGEPAFLAGSALQMATSHRANWHYFGTNGLDRTEGYRQIIVPFWLVVVVFALLPALGLIRSLHYLRL